ncbi:hypothetical protein DVK05_03685 [Halorubrum sp. Atlit-8R]|uniref:DUF5779 family protein n=1 Tax=unclassified Halorubrum TaxID=2642239 RepID=UPI000EF238D1|nr:MULTISPECIES: DUF5779 family protein [unclassified Halorubrum]RLM70945.1 hypothetical protein DVK08_02075 [Halorubrum sp. Atlit-9R]RLM71813.1 hypothetical protein DVK08_06820 [Halorubrum sp. Atlit-9R]RLM82902.1 hypothetical protein DVK05_03685 [Halorubrum sp. Atlit-8R]
MSDWDLDLRDAEAKMDEAFAAAGDVVLGVLDGTTDPEEWVRSVDYGNTLVLSIDGDLNELAAPFARDVKDMDGELMHFRGFLVVTPPGVSIDTDRLSDSGGEESDGSAGDEPDDTDDTDEIDGGGD